MTTVDTLRGLRALVATALSRIDEALEAEANPEADLRRGKTPDAILRLIRRRGPMKPAEIAEALRDAGRDVSGTAVSTACVRHARSGALRRVGSARYDVGDARLVQETAGGGA